MAFNWKPPTASPSMQARAKANMTQCKSCGGTEFDDFCESGDRACAQCGTVMQENGIVSTVQFSESGGSSNVVGQFVSGDKGRPSGGGASGRGRGRFGHTRDSRETTIQNGKKKILQVLAQLHLRHSLAEPAGRLFALCVNQNYVQGRKTMNIVAACVYIVCRQQHFPIMLIDISDKLSVNVYVLGKTFQKLIKYLNIQTAVPIVDPAMYIKRFAAKLDLGNKTNAVCMTALKIISSMKRDFLASGRQPAGVCCAALTLATRVNRVERSKEEIRKAVKVCDATIRKRLLEFEATPTSQLTVEELSKLPQDGSFPGAERTASGSVGGTVSGRGGRDGRGSGTGGQATVLVSDVRMDPPSFIANRIRDGRLSMPWTEPLQQPASPRTPQGKKKSRKRSSPSKVVQHDAGDGAPVPSIPDGSHQNKMAVSIGEAGRDPPGGTQNGGCDKGVERDKVKAGGDKGQAPRHGVPAAGGDSDANGAPREKTGGEEDERSEEGNANAEGPVFRGAASDVAGGKQQPFKSKGKGKGMDEDKQCHKSRAGGAVDDDDNEEEDDDEEEGNEDDEDDDEDERSEGSSEERQEEEELGLPLEIDANTEEGREALTRHVLQVRKSGIRSRMVAYKSKRSRVEERVYSALDNIFDEDEKRARGVSRTDGETRWQQSEDPNTSRQNSAFGGGTVDHVETAEETPAAAAVGEDGVQNEAEGAANGNTAGGDLGDGLKWDVYLRTPEDEERTKLEWEKDHRDWIEDQEEKTRLLKEEAESLVHKKKRKYTLSSSKMGMGTFREVLQTEAAKNKSLKINHEALQKVMNLDGSFKQIDGDDNDEPMEEIFEDNPAPQLAIPHSMRDKGARGGAVKAALTIAPMSSGSPLALPVAGSSVLPPTSRSRGGAAEAPPTSTDAANSGRKASANGRADGVQQQGQQQHLRPDPERKAVQAEVATSSWAQAGPEDGGESAIKNALALLQKGGLDSLPSIASVAARTREAGADVDLDEESAAGLSAAGRGEEGSLERQKGDEARSVGPSKAGAERGGGHGAARGAKAEEVAQDEEEEEEEDDEEDEEDEDDGYSGRGRYMADDDDDDPYGEEA